MHMCFLNISDHCFIDAIITLPKGITRDCLVLFPSAQRLREMRVSESY